MEYKLKFANGRSSSIHCMDNGTPLQDKINAEEKRFGSEVVKINGKPVKEHALGGFIIGALLGAGAVGLTKREPGTKKVYVKIPSGSSKPKPKSNKPKLSTISKYLSKDSISEVKSTEGKEYKGTDILDGVHVKKDKFGTGGHVSKGEMVWKKLTPAQRLEFLNENTTPAITPRTQETLSGKSYNFLPKAVKIMVESFYADKEEGEYKTGGVIEYVETDRDYAIKGYTRAGALKRIKSMLKSDKELLDGSDISEFSDDDLFDIGFNYYGFDYAENHEGEYKTGGKLTKDFTLDLNSLDRYIRSTQSRLENEYSETENGQMFADKSRKALVKMKEDYDYNWLKSQKDNYPSVRWSDMVEMIDAYERWMLKKNEAYYGTDKFMSGGGVENSKYIVRDSQGNSSATYKFDNLKDAEQKYDSLIDYVKGVIEEEDGDEENTTDYIVLEKYVDGKGYETIRAFDVDEYLESFDVDEYKTGGKLTKDFTLDLNSLDRYIRSTQSRLENEYSETENGQMFADKSRKALSKMKEDYDYNWLKSQKDNYPSVRWSDMVEMIDAYERWMHTKNEDYYGTDKFMSGGVSGTSVLLGNYHRNIMGTLSFDLLMTGMRKPQDFIVYPVSEATTKIMIQSDKRIGRIDMTNGKGEMSQNHQGGAYGHHLSFDTLIPFQLTPDQLTELKEKLSMTAGSKVGRSVIYSDNSGADKFAPGGSTGKKDAPSDKEDFDLSGLNMQIWGRGSESLVVYYDSSEIKYVFDQNDKLKREFSLGNSTYVYAFPGYKLKRMK